MKKIITEGFLLAAVLGTNLQISNAILTHNKVNNLANIAIPKEKSIAFNHLEKYFNGKNTQEKSILKTNLLHAIGLNNGVIVFDKTKLKVKLWDLKIYEFMTSNEYINVLNLYYKNGLLFLNKNMNFAFKDNIKCYNNER